MRAWGGGGSGAKHTLVHFCVPRLPLGPQLHERGRRACHPPQQHALGSLELRHDEQQAGWSIAKHYQTSAEGARQRVEIETSWLLRKPKNGMQTAGRPQTETPNHEATLPQHAEGQGQLAGGEKSAAVVLDLTIARSLGATRSACVAVLRDHEWVSRQAHGDDAVARLNWIQREKAPCASYEAAPRYQGLSDWRRRCAPFPANYKADSQQGETLGELIRRATTQVQLRDNFSL
jgi:hypothetical protein